MLGGRFRATKVEAQSAPLIQRAIGLSSLFQSRLAETPKKPLAPVLEVENSQPESLPENLVTDTTLEKKEDI